MTDFELKIARKTTDEKLKRDFYAEYITELIRERYSASDELAILRQRDSKPEDFAEYNSFAEECKARAKAVIYG